MNREKNLKERIEKECFVTNHCIFIDDMVEFVKKELDKAREEWIRRGMKSVVSFLVDNGYGGIVMKELDDMKLSKMIDNLISNGKKLKNGIGLAKPRKDCDCAYCREYFGSVGDDPSEEQPAKYNTKEILINGTKPLDIKTEEEKKELKCMKCGSKENLNSNRDNSFVECDKCMWEKDEPEEILVEKEFIWYRIKLGETLKKIAEKNGIDDIEREDGFTKVGWKVLWEFNKDLIPNPNRLIYVDEDQYEDGWCINHKQGILRIPISKLKE